jgi:hypothetical protein
MLNGSWKTTLGSQETYFETGSLKEHSTLNTLSQGVVEEGEMLTMMTIMSESHTMSVTSPCASDSGY